MAGIYVHVPFCTSKCFYCSFYSSTSLNFLDEVVEATIKELELRKEYLKGEEIETIYFGGGTPSLLSAHHLEKILNTIYRLFPVSKNPEITLEANPDDVNEEILKTWYHLGLNRLSLGFQTFSDRLLKLMNRRHNLHHALECVKSLEKSSFDNFNLDLIFAIPTQTHEEVVFDINRMLEIKPPHISAYMMTFEERSVFGVWLKQRVIEEQSEDFCSQSFLFIDEKLREQGYEHYEISNFARDGKFSRHNSNYWLNDKKFLGVGPAAASFNIVSRQTNVENKFTYVESISKNIIPCQREVLTHNDIVNEFIFNNLRTSRGLDLAVLKNQYHHSLDENVLNFLIEKKFLQRENDNVILTSQGMIVSNRILEYFFVE